MSDRFQVIHGVRYRIFTQRAFTKCYQGEEQVGVCIRQMFYPLWGLGPDHVLTIREPVVGGAMEYTLDGQDWHRFRHGRPI